MRTSLLVLTRGRPINRIWYCDPSGRKVGKKTPLTLTDFADFFEKLPARVESDRSWTVDFTARRRQATKDAKPFRHMEATKKGEADALREALELLKKVRPRGDAGVAAEATLAEEVREAREAAAKAQAVEDAVYDL